MTVRRPTVEDVAVIATELGFHSAAGAAEEYAPLVDAALTAYDALDATPPEPPDRAAVAHHRPSPEDDPRNAWVVRAEIAGSEHGALRGRTVAVKDSIMVAGLPMTNGTRLLDGFVPAHDATVVARVLAAGATVVGKTSCEYLCLSGGSHTSDFGPTHHPHRAGVTAGGSSSGSAVAVVTGDADLALGTDQAGSVRVPAAYSGLVGLKPTHGLVPYTGIAPLEPVIDHVGPMTRTVADAARLLAVIAGDDGVDPRRRRPSVGDYVGALDLGLDGLRVGVLWEGCAHADPGVGGLVTAAARDLHGLGAQVSPVSVPHHHDGLALWTPLVVQGTRDVVLDGQGFGTGRDDRYPLDLMEHLLERRDRRDEMPANVVVCALVAEIVARERGATAYAAAVNAVRGLRRDYDRAIADVDALLLPTTPTTAPDLPAPDAPIAARVGATNDMFANTAPFNATGHPAISLPCGEVDGLPAGLMIVGRRHDDATVLRIAHAYERRDG